MRRGEKWPPLPLGKAGAFSLPQEYHLTGRSFLRRGENKKYPDMADAF